MERFQADKPGVSRESADEAGAREPTLVGPYRLLAEIGRGDLATLHLAKKHSTLGFQRLYALKRLKPALAGSLEHVELLLDEARLMSSIHHANIAGVLDVGTDAGSYIVMEYVEGENLESLLGRAGSARHARYVVPPLVDALHGLHALHTATDDLGESGSIVHQAPRARHVLVGVDGTARLIDFSQVRAPNVRPSRCRSDRLKVAYMAPEMALHPDGVDLRADLFVMGITLWEALTGERLFAGDNDDQTFQNMLHRRIPRPSEVGLKPPRGFDAICIRALERDRSKRYGSALEMARDLRDMALNQALYATSAEIGDWVRELAGKELRERRRSSGMDTPSSASIPLETPTFGFVERGAPSQVTAAAASGSEAGGRASLLPSASPADGDLGASQTLVVGDVPAAARDESAEAAATPPVGMRRAPLPRAEVSDDEPTGRRSSLPQPSRSAPTARPAPLIRNEELARAVTLPMAVQAIPSGAQTVGTTGAAAPPDASGPDAMDEGDQTQPNRFVPARPGARRDGSTASPGAYSQVDARRARPAGAERGTGGNFDEVATTTHPAQVARTERAGERAPSSGERSSAPPAAGSQRNRTSPLPARRITETPPTYVQRRDSNPTRMQIPDGPVGAPHRSFPQDDVNSDVHRVDMRGVAQSRDKVDVRGREPANPDEAREQSHPRVRRAELAGLHVGMVDSLSPSTTAALTTPPEPLAPAGRSWPLWLASGVLAAIILLAVGVGVRQWMAGPARPLPSTRHVAREREPEPAFEAPVREPPAAALPAGRAVPPSTPAPVDVGASRLSPAPATLQAGRPVGAAPAGDRQETRVAPRPVPAARRLAPPAAGEVPVKRYRPARPAGPAPAGLPDNPY